MPGPSLGLYAQLSTEKKPLVSRNVGEISTNDALFQEQAATAVAAAASPPSEHSLALSCMRQVPNRRSNRRS
jgi:hypothetical protein